MFFVETGILETRDNRPLISGSTQISESRFQTKTS